MACLDEVAAAAADGLNDLLALARRLQVLSRLRHMLAPLAHRRASSSVRCCSPWLMWREMLLG